MLTRIATHDVEPTDLDVALAPRLNLLVGDNGLGKTYLLDLAWWALTGTWARRAPMPVYRPGSTPKIDFNSDPLGEATITGSFNFREQTWARETGRDLWAPKLVIAAGPDGGFDIWDAYRSWGTARPGLGQTCRFSLDSRAVWDGLVTEDSSALSNGLVRDWVTWQFQKPAVFDLLVRVLARLSPPGEVIKPGAPRRVSIEDARDIPTITLPYGTVPVTHASAGVRRVLALAYVLVWTWYEHTEAANLMNLPPIERLTLLVDEVDVHLHPTWQRAILPALLEVLSEIGRTLEVQVVASTHAPLVLASVETIFDQERDKLIHFALRDGKITVEDLPWAKQGDAENWLVSEVFGLTQARSLEAERAIEVAEAFMRGEPTPAELDTREKIQIELERVLGGQDKFWPRWLVKTGLVT